MRAIAQDADAARLMGIDVNRTISFTFLLGGAPGRSGRGHLHAVLHDDPVGRGLPAGLIAFTAAVIGGIGNLRGAVVGGVDHRDVQPAHRRARPGLGQQWTQTVVFSILILIIVFKPEGLFGRRRGEGLMAPPPHPRRPPPRGARCCRTGPAPSAARDRDPPAVAPGEARWRHRLLAQGADARPDLAFIMLALG